MALQQFAELIEKAAGLIIPVVHASTVMKSKAAQRDTAHEAYGAMLLAD